MAAPEVVFAVQQYSQALEWGRELLLHCSVPDVEAERLAILAKAPGEAPR